MSKAKEIRRQRAEERSRDKAKSDAVLAERNRCASICEAYAGQASAHGMIVHPMIAQHLADEIRKEPT